MLRPVSRRELISKLRRLGFAGPFSGSRHQFMEKDDFKIFIPNPHDKDIGKELIKQIIKDLKISEKDFFEL